jgi:hypothetical protein
LKNGPIRQASQKGKRNMHDWKEQSKPATTQVGVGTTNQQCERRQNEPDQHFCKGQYAGRFSGKHARSKAGLIGQRRWRMHILGHISSHFSLEVQVRHIHPSVVGRWSMSFQRRYLADSCSPLTRRVAISNDALDAVQERV